MKLDAQSRTGNSAAIGDRGFTPPAVSLSKGGGAIRSIGEKFAANPVTGTGSMSVPIKATPGRSGFGPQISLSYDSGAGNGPFGLGWSASIPAITRKTDKGLPRYSDAAESDEYVLSGVEDLVPALAENDGIWVRMPDRLRAVDGRIYRIQRYRPRIENFLLRIERWTSETSPGDSFWRSITHDNVTTWYGRTGNSRITDPSDESRTFSWLICESYDDKGNVVSYEYKAEDSTRIDQTNTHEAHRTEAGRSANRYVKHVRYGNLAPYFPALPETEPITPLPSEWLFELVFDYGEHDPGTPTPADTVEWPVRNDPFSSYRAGFEIRTYRLCRRVLMFHHFPNESGVGADCLVSSTDFGYRHQEAAVDPRNPIHSVMTSLTQRSYRRLDVGYRMQALPRLEFDYSEAAIHEDVVHLDRDSLGNLPQGLDNVTYRWVDLDGEGLPGILSEQGAGWFYKRNLSVSALRLGPMEKVDPMPSPAALRGGRQQLVDLSGDGQLDVAAFETTAAGFFERSMNEDWHTFKAFESLPVLDWSDPNLRFVDLTGDGHADVLVTEHEAFVWFPSLGEAGFGSPETVRQALNEEQGPRLVFNDRSQSIYLADFSGDGLPDLVRIRNGEICYWPTLGYGCFGAKVTMDNAPRFDTIDAFDQSRIRLADIDGSGVTDILYLHTDEVTIYYNQAGNSWSSPHRLRGVPRIDELSSIHVIDLVGNGTACLVWSSPLAGDAQSPLRYVDLMGGVKPHLLIGSRNNLGAETRVQYAPSTRFYVQDSLEGRPWITRVPFVTHVIERVETFDHISRNRFVTRYAYHHGHFDGVDREFRGFGMVEQFDTEEFATLIGDGSLPPASNVDESSHVPVVYIRTWSHTGVHLDRRRISDYFAGTLSEEDPGEYYREPGLSDEQAERLLLPDTVLPQGLTDEEEQEACRALKGSLLRQEVFARDGSEMAPRPYTVTERNFTVRRIQPKAGNRHAVFATHSREAVNYHYERNPADPRAIHELTLDVDDFGNVLASATVGYGRRQPDPELAPADQTRQAAMWIGCAESRHTNAIEEDDTYRSPVVCENTSFELTGLTVDANLGRLTFEAVRDAVQSAATIDYHESPLPETLERRVLERSRTLYRRNDLDGPLPLAELQSLGLPFETYRLALTPAHLEAVYGERVDDEMLRDEAAYRHSEGDANWWIPSGQVFLSGNDGDAAAGELTEARAHFFLPRRFRNPFGAISRVEYDRYDLQLVETVDAIGNRVTSAINYRVLQPELVTDPNGNRTAVAFDTMGLVAGTAIMGKLSENAGDSNEGFEADLTDDQIAAFFQEPRGPLAAEFLGNATTRFIYDLGRFQRSRATPGFAITLARETHSSDPTPPDGLRIEVRIAYSDGFGRVIQNKEAAEPGPSGGVPRWVGSGWTVFNNKGAPVRKYEPFFSGSHDFEFARLEGVSDVLFYDPVGRMVASLHPDHTWQKTTFDSWRQFAHDVNDTVLTNPAEDLEVGDFFRRLEDTQYLPTWHALRTDPAHAAEAATRWPDAQRRDDEAAAAVKTAAHAATPAVVYLDSLGRPFLSVSDNGDEGRYETRIELDIEDNALRVIDARGNVMISCMIDRDGLPSVPGYDVAGRRLHESGVDGSRRQVLLDIGGKAIRRWDSRGHTLRSTYDALRRARALFVQRETEPEVLADLIVYGEDHPDADSLNLRGHVYEAFDGGGVAINARFDFKGNLQEARRQLARDYRATADWLTLAELRDISEIETTAAPLLESEVFTTRSDYDALNRPVAVTTPDDSVTLTGYNEAGLLERIAVRLQGSEPAMALVSNIDYNAKGQREQITYATRDGTSVTTTYEYDSVFRVTRLHTVRLRDDRNLQDLNYVHDPAGNVTSIRDNAQQTVFFGNAEIAPHNDYTYDPQYRLIRAEGREHAAQNNFQRSAEPFNALVGIPFPNSPEALQRYSETYAYDSVGNLLNMRHVGGVAERWNRRYEYAQVNNRLLGTSLPGDAAGIFSARYDHDAHGNVTSMPHLSLMQWNFNDQLQASSRQAVTDGVPETTYYVYDASGERLRKVTERQDTTGGLPTRRSERIYSGIFEVYREYGSDGATLGLERETLSFIDDRQRIAQIDTRTQGDADDAAQNQCFRLGNNVGSCVLEIDEEGNVVSYEEFHPYGTTAYCAGRSESEVSLKRRRYMQKERDEETGLYYYGARYYSCWLARWCSVDPAKDENLRLSPYLFVAANPVKFIDPDGKRFVMTVDPKNRTVTYKAKIYTVSAESFVEATEVARTLNKYRGATTSNQDGKLWQVRFDISVFRPPSVKALENHEGKRLRFKFGKQNIKEQAFQKAAQRWWVPFLKLYERSNLYLGENTPIKEVKDFVVQVADQQISQAMARVGAEIRDAKNTNNTQAYNNLRELWRTLGQERLKSPGVLKARFANPFGTDEGSETGFMTGVGINQASSAGSALSTGAVSTTDDAGSATTTAASVSRGTTFSATVTQMRRFAGGDTAAHKHNVRLHEFFHLFFQGHIDTVPSVMNYDFLEQSKSTKLVPQFYDIDTLFNR